MRIVSILIYAALIVSQSFAADKYLDKAATGANNGTSWTDAWTNALTAAATVASGDTLWIQGGDYRDPGMADPNAYTMLFSSRINLSVKIATNAAQPAYFDRIRFYNVDNSSIDGWLNNTQYIRVTGTPQTYAVGVKTNQPFVFYLASCTNFNVRGIEATRQAYYSNDVKEVHCFALWDKCNFVTVSNCWAHHTSGDALNQNQGVAEGWDRYTVVSNLFENIGDDGSQFGPYGATYIGNQVHCRKHPQWFGHADGIQAYPGCRYIKVIGNTFSGFSQCIFLEKAKGPYIVANNVVWDDHTSGSWAGMVCGGTNDFEFAVIANNVFYNYVSFMAWKGGDTILNVNPAGRIVRNNVFVNCKIVCFNDYLNYWSPNDGNVWWDEPGVQFYTSEGVPTTKGDGNVGTMLNVNPKFLNTTNGDFRISADSPLIGIATNLNPWYTVDRAGTTRGLTWDSGPYQYSVVSNIAPTISVQPLSQSKLQGDAVTFSVTASGYPYPTYQWRKDGSSIGGATATSYSILSVLSTDAGLYSCLISNSVGVVTSTAATLTVSTISTNRHVRGNGTVKGAFK